MSTDYTKKKNAELEDLLKSRSLPHTGKKAELVARLQQHDADQAAASKPTTAGNEDEIDWEDDAAAATDPASAAAIAAGGLTAPANPTAVPNQIPATDPSKTSDLTIDPTPTTADDTTKPSTDAPPPPAAPKPDLSANLPTTTLDSELEKRRARAARFGIKESDSDALKAIERAKKFGTGDAGDRAAVKGLDEALPERGVKRGRGREGGEGREEKRSKVRGGRVGRQRSATPKEGRARGGGGGLSEKDRLAAEARKAKFAQKA